MRRRMLLRLSFGLAVLAAAVLLVAPSAVESAAPIGSGPGCTVVYAADDQTALGGNNEDGFNPLTRIWFVPGVDGAFGSAWVGYDDLVIQGGMNEAGLFFDGLAVRVVTVPPKPGKPELTGGSAFTHVMSQCDSVACVRRFYDETSLPGTWNGQALFGDRFGNSLIIEPLTIVPKDGRFQVATNFFQSEVPAAQRTDPRYVTAMSLLSWADRFSADLIRDVLEATRQQGDVNTLYSTVYDLKARTIDLYYFQDFGTKVTFDLRAELAKGVHGYDIPALFARNETAETIAAPIRSQMSAALEQLPQATLQSADLAALAGTYELPPSVRLEVMAKDNVLLGRRPWTPWVPLRPLSSTRFAHVFSDPTGSVRRFEMQFSPGAAGAAAAVEITDGTGNRAVATRASTPPVDATLDPLFIGIGAVAIAVAIVVGIAYLRRGQGLRPGPPTTMARP